MAASSAHSGTLGIVTLITWLSTASLGAYMLRGLVAAGGLRRQRTIRDGLPPEVLFGHFGLALTGLVVWVSYLATGWAALAWSAVGLCTVILWTPYPDPSVTASAGPLAGPGGAGPAGRGLAGPAEDVVTGRLTDEMMARALTDDALVSKFIDELLASVPADPSQAVKKPRAHPAALIPFGHGLASVATFVLAVVTAVGAS
jgi:manganese efflux pump family protein